MNVEAAHDLDGEVSSDEATKSGGGPHLSEVTSARVQAN